MGAPPPCLCWLREGGIPLAAPHHGGISILQHPPVPPSTLQHPPAPHYTPHPRYRDPKYPLGGAGAHLEEAESRHPAGPALLVLAAQQLQALGAAAHLVGLRGEDRTITGQPPLTPPRVPVTPWGAETLWQSWLGSPEGLHLDAEAELGGRPVVLLALRHVVDVGLGEVGEVLQVPGVLGPGRGRQGPAPPPLPPRSGHLDPPLTLDVPLVE